MSAKGLTTLEAKQLLITYGPNEIPSKKVSMWVLLASKFWGPLPWLVELAVVLTLINAIISGGEAWIDFGVLLFLLVVNGLIGFHEDSNANKAVEALQHQLAPTAHCLRDGEMCTIEARELVPGDVVTLKSGAVVPADCEVLPGSGSVEVDEAALTGESLPVHRGPGDLVKSASIVRRGDTLGLVKLTGARTFLGEAISLVSGAAPKSVPEKSAAATSAGQHGMINNDGVPVNAMRHLHWWHRFRSSHRNRNSEEQRGRVHMSHMHRILMALTRTLIGVAVIAVVILIVILIGVERRPFLSVLSLCLVVLVASIPVALEVVSTAVLAVGARKLSQEGVIVTRLGAIEEMANVEVLCSDKTGTLTMNALTLHEPWCVGDCTPDRALMYAALTLKRGDTDAVDTCILASADGNEAVTKELRKFKMDVHKPFDPETKVAWSVVSNKNGEVLRAAKGAVPQLVAMCGDSLSKETLADVEKAVVEYARRGLRTLGVAWQTMESSNDTLDSGNWHLAALLTLSDPPRPDSKKTIQELHQLGLNVKMITGDHLAIAIEAGKEIGMERNGIPLQFWGEDFLAAVDSGSGRFNGEDTSVLMRCADGFAGVSPKHKFEIVQELQTQHYLVAMTGDGVNDAPALHRADVGIAVHGATDAAKAAADMILLEPGINVIAEAVNLSRSVFARVESYVAYRVSATFEFVIFFLAAILLLGYSIPPVALIAITLLNDFVSVSVAYDNARAQPLPSRWNLPSLTRVAVTLGSVATIGVFVMTYMFTTVHGPHSPVIGAVKALDGTNAFGLAYDPRCFYALPEAFGLAGADVICNPECPGAGSVPEDPTLCGDFVGYSELISVIVMMLSIGGQLKIFVCRAGHDWFFGTRMPSIALFASSMMCWVTTLLLAGLMNKNLGLSATFNVVTSNASTSPRHIVDVVWHKAPPIMLLWSVIACVILLFIEDGAKKLIYSIESHFLDPHLHTQDAFYHIPATHVAPDEPIQMEKRSIEERSFGRVDKKGGDSEDSEEIVSKKDKKKGKKDSKSSKKDKESGKKDKESGKKDKESGKSKKKSKKVVEETSSEETSSEESKKESIQSSEESSETVDAKNGESESDENDEEETTETEAETESEESEQVVVDSKKAKAENKHKKSKK